MQLASEIAALHARHPACGFNRSLVVHLDLSASSVALARHVYAPYAHHAHTVHTACVRHACAVHTPCTHRVHRKDAVHLDLCRARLAARGLLSTPAPTPGEGGNPADRSSGATHPSGADPSAAAHSAPAAVRGVPGVRVRLVRGSLLELSSLNLGRFDYVNCVGVLHHLPGALRGP